MQPRPSKVNAPVKRKEEPLASALRKAQWSREAESGHSSTWDYLPGTDMNLDAEEERREPNPLTWDPSPGSKAFMTGRGRDKGLSSDS